jgi:hypothetical protein
LIICWGFNEDIVSYFGACLYYDGGAKEMTKKIEPLVTTRMDLERLGLLQFIF